MPELRLEELARLVGGRLRGDGSKVITGAGSIKEAGPGDITFLAGKRYVKELDGCRAGALILSDERLAPHGVDLVLVDNPHLAFAKVLEVLRPLEHPRPGIDPMASVHTDAVVGDSVYVGAFSVIEKGARVGDGAVIYPSVYVGRDVEIGGRTVLYPGVRIMDGCRVGRRVIIHCNAVIGSDGFGYAKEGKGYYKIPQRGIVRIEDDVEIGASTTIDRATTGETIIGRGTKIDNLVQIAHNVKIGEDTVIVAQVGISGSTEVGSRVTLAGQVGVVGHIRIGDDTVVGAQSGVSRGLPEGGAFTGTPAMPHGEWLRAQALYSKLPELKKRLDELERRLKALEGRAG